MTRPPMGTKVRVTFGSTDPRGWIATVRAWHSDGVSVLASLTMDDEDRIALSPGDYEVLS